MKFVEESSACKLRIVCDYDVMSSPTVMTVLKNTRRTREERIMCNLSSPSSPTVISVLKNTRRTREERKKPRDENDYNMINVSSIKKYTVLLESTDCVSNIGT